VSPGHSMTSDFINVFNDCLTFPTTCSGLFGEIKEAFVNRLEPIENPPRGFGYARKP
jgi:hypothetical protein